MACACTNAGKPKCARSKEAEKLGRKPSATTASGELATEPYGGDWYVGYARSWRLPGPGPFLVDVTAPGKEYG
jgi:hypothetical protein